MVVRGAAVVGGVVVGATVVDPDRLDTSPAVRTAVVGTATADVTFEPGRVVDVDLFVVEVVDGRVVVDGSLVGDVDVVDDPPKGTVVVVVVVVPEVATRWVPPCDVTVAMAKPPTARASTADTTQAPTGQPVNQERILNIVSPPDSSFDSWNSYEFRFRVPGLDPAR
ncbi:MAG TPA: hypothetical protein VFP54_00885 [Acidimicrobiales bacterium]|nr:hypothetical protein [Acidimicrobiales bacterium]